MLNPKALQRVIGFVFMSYSLKHLPPLHPREKPIKLSLWIVALVIIVLFSILFIKIFGHDANMQELKLFVLGIPILVWIILFIIRVIVWLLIDTKANAFDYAREEWIIDQTRQSRRALQILSSTFITKYADNDDTHAVNKMLASEVMLSPQTDWNEAPGIRMSRITNHNEENIQDAITRLFIQLIDEQLFSEIPIDTPLAVAILSSPSQMISKGEIKECWQEAWQLSEYDFSVEYIHGEGLNLIDEWLNHRFAEQTMLFVVGLQIAPNTSNGTAESAVGLLFGNRLAQHAFTPIALLHRPDCSSLEEQAEGMRMAAYYVPIEENVVSHLWIAGINDEQIQQVTLNEKAYPIEHLDNKHHINLDVLLGHAGAAAPWLAIAAAVELSIQNQSHQLVICNDHSQDEMWNVVVSPTIS